MRLPLPCVAGGSQPGLAGVPPTKSDHTETTRPDTRFGASVIHLRE